MKKFFLLTFFFSICILNSFGQCNFQVLGPDDYKQPSYDGVSFTNIAIDGNGTVFICFMDALRPKSVSVRKYTGNKTWVSVGQDYLFEGSVYNASLAVDPTGIPYIAFNDGNFIGPAAVAKFDGTNWVKLAPNTISTGAIAAAPTIAINSIGVPYIAYTDRLNSYKAIVKKFDGTNWVAVGTGGIVSDALGEVPIIALSANDIPYLLYQDTQPSTHYGTVKKFDGTNWVLVGTRGFTSTSISEHHLAIDKNGVPFITYQLNESLHHAGTVMKFDGSTWVDVGTPGFAIGYAKYNYLAFDQNNVPYIAYCPSEDHLVVEKFNNTDWEEVGEQDTTALASNSSIAFAPDGSAHVISLEKSWTLKANVKKYENGTWTPLGSIGISAGAATYTMLSVDDAGNPYVFYRNIAELGEGASVQKFDGTNWQYVGTPYITSPMTYFTSALDRQNHPWIAYASVDKLTVKKFDGSNWLTVGGLASSDGYVNGRSLTFDNSNTPYLFYRDFTENSKGTVRKFDGTSWNLIGPAGFTNDAFTSSIAVDNNGVIYIGFQDGFNGKASVMKYADDTWTQVGIRNFSVTRADFTSMVLDASGVPYMAYSDFGNSKKVTVKKFDGSDWVTVGAEGFSQGQADEVSLAIDPNGVLYVAYKDIANQSRASLMRFDGTAWIVVETAFSAGYANTVSLAVAQNGKPYVGYSNGGMFAYGFCPQEVVTNTETATAEEQQNVILYPNPNNGIFYVELQEETTIQITNAYGQIVFEQLLTQGKHMLDFDEKPKGLYVLKISKNKNSKNIKFIKE